MMNAENGYFKLYGINKWNSKLYDMVIHIKTLTIENTVDIIFETIQKNFKATPASHKIINDMALSAHFQTVLMKLVPMISFIADDGIIHIGIIEEKKGAETKTIARIKKFACKIEEVKEIIINLISKKDKPDHINPFYNME